MASHDAVTRRLPFLRDFSARDRELANKAARQQEDRQRKTREARARKVEGAIESFRRRLHDLLGARRSAELREAIRRERLTFHDLLQPPGGLTRDPAKQKKASRKKIDGLLKKLGATPERVGKIIGEHTEALQEIHAAADGKVTPGFHLTSNLDKWRSLSPNHTLPLPWGVFTSGDPNDPHRWFVERAPWFGFLFRFEFDASDNFRVNRRLFLDPSAGLVGNEVTMDCNSADDADVATASAEAQIAFGFQPPAAGLVEVLIDAQSTVCTHRLKVEDEFGFSSAWANQNNYLMMNVLHPNVPAPSLALMSSPFRARDGGPAFSARVSEGEDYFLEQEYLTRGQHYFASLVSSGPVPAGRSVVVSVGTRSADYGWVDDMEYHGRSDFQWFISSVEVRIAP
jgi:hypothetical protein